MMVATASSCNSGDPHGENLPIGHKIPEFSVVTLDGVGYDDKTFQGNNEYFAILVFKADCGLCEVRAHQLKHTLPEFYPILGFSISSEEDTKEFLESNELKNFLPTAVVTDKDFISKFLQNEPPAILVFNENGILIDKILKENYTKDELLARMVKDPTK